MDSLATSSASQINIGIFIAIIGFLGVVVGALVTGLFQRKKTNAEADKDCADANEQIRQTVMSLLEPLNVKVNMLEKELEDWKNWALALFRQVKALGGEPVQFKSHKDKEG
jgi:hypothetical protein